MNARTIVQVIIGGFCLAIVASAILETYRKPEATS